MNKKLKEKFRSKFHLIKNINGNEYLITCIYPLDPQIRAYTIVIDNEFAKFCGYINRIELLEKLGLLRFNEESILITEDADLFAGEVYGPIKSIVHNVLELQNYLDLIFNTLQNKQ